MSSSRSHSPRRHSSGNLSLGSSGSHHGPLHESPGFETVPLSAIGGSNSSPGGAAAGGGLSGSIGGGVSLVLPKMMRSWVHQARMNRLSTALAAVALILLFVTVQVDDETTDALAGGNSREGVVRGASVASALAKRKRGGGATTADDEGQWPQTALTSQMSQLQSKYRKYLSLPPPPKKSALGSFQGHGVAPPQDSLVGAEVALLPAGESPVAFFMPHLAPLSEPLSPTDTPLFFHIPRAGTSIKSILTSCLGLILATDAGMQNGHDRDKAVRVVELPKGARYVNVDTTTAPGIDRAAALQLIPSQLADVVATPYAYRAVTSLYNVKHRARLFTTIRHPIDRAVSLYYYLSVADWEPTYDPDLAFVNIDMYARSDRVENNWMVRFLTGETTGALTQRHLDMAKEILRNYCLVGLVEEKVESLKRFEAYFGLSYRSEGGRQCRDKFLMEDFANKHDHPSVEEGSPTWTLLYRKNELDMELYEYALQVFRDQAQLFGEGGMYNDQYAALAENEGQQNENQQRL